ncbi:MAG: DUF305 domain-containing protein [Gemmatimonadota bacterium]
MTNRSDRPTRRSERLALALLVALAAGCSAVRAAPEPAPRATAVRPAADTTRKGYTAADVQFMQGMIGHHAQAVVMAALVPERTARRDLHMLAERITVSQESEMEFMRSWLRRRGEAVPDTAAHAHAAAGHGTLMPGMLTHEQLTQLTNAAGPEFERLFLQFMIQHHEGALQMVRQLFATQGSGQDPEIFMFASDVDADQSAEIRRMSALLTSLQ